MSDIIQRTKKAPAEAIADRMPMETVRAMFDRLDPTTDAPGTHSWTPSMCKAERCSFDATSADGLCDFHSEMAKFRQLEPPTLEVKPGLFASWWTPWAFVLAAMTVWAALKGCGVQ